MSDFQPQFGFIKVVRENRCGKCGEFWRFINDGSLAHTSSECKETLNYENAVYYHQLYCKGKGTV